MRFGQTVNLEDLDKAELDSASEDLRAEISELERQQQRQLQKWEDHLVQVKMDLSEVVRENTTKLEQLADLQQQLQALEKDLQTSEVSVMKKLLGEREPHRDEREAVKDDVVRRAQLMEQLRAEIEMLRRKSFVLFVTLL